ncbi:hypothetical protein N431DRAFT_534014 [Stipitochalara longipes BDJ]|nr:hypothetical protein N431DRAFT_534014 [Stipitochalara longipes BDJ]
MHLLCFFPRFLKSKYRSDSNATEVSYQKLTGDSAKDPEPSMPSQASVCMTAAEELEERNAWLREGGERGSWYREKPEAVENIIRALGANYPTLQSLIIVHLPRPKEPFPPPDWVSEYTQKEALLAETLRKGGIDSEKIVNNLIWRIRSEHKAVGTLTWWQSKGYHCSLIVLVSTRKISIGGCYCFNPDSFLETRMRYASVEEYLDVMQQSKTYRDKDHELHIVQLLGGSPFNPPYAGVITSEDTDSKPIVSQSSTLVETV